ncbi:hypothetical protein [Pseudogemmobacter sonorensis]|uniref:hypothetical protein n=1 Tax=Pseudogemmobacter sonorensis TaxID=2989681 RepID=UPI0036D16A5B
MTAAPLRITAPLRLVERHPLGQRVGGAEGTVGGLPVIITLTEDELHIAFTHVDAPAAVVNLMDVTRAATAATAAALFGAERRS